MFETLITLKVYLHDHPSLWILAWPFLTALITSFFSEATIAKLPKPAAAAIHFLKASGLDARMVLTVIQAVLTGSSLPTWPQLPPPPFPTPDSPPGSSKTSGTPPTGG
jgi:hypothetical protein